MKKLWFSALDKLRDFIYKHRNLYERKPVYEKNLKNKSLDELIFLKESEHDYLSFNIPTALGILGATFIFNNVLWKSLFVVLLLITLVNIRVAADEKKKNIKVYNKVISKKSNEQRKNEENYKKEILEYLRLISNN